MRQLSNAGWFFILLTAGLAVPLSAADTDAQTGPGISGLRCEYLVNPLGIDVEKPRLSWALSQAGRSGPKAAYRILVSTTPEGLEKDTGDLWDSGKTTSQESTWIVYGGKPLVSRSRAYWKVRVWDGAGRQSTWSAPAMWSMGLLQPSDWFGKWIGEQRPAGAKQGKPLPSPWLRKTFMLSGKPGRATAYVNALGYYELYINGKKVDDHVLSPAVSDYSKRSLYVTHDVTAYLAPGKNVAVLWLGRGWYVRGHPGVIHDGPLVRAQVEIEMPEGQPVKVGTDETWKVHESPITPLGKGLAFGDYGGERYDARLELAGWNTTAFDDSAWQAAGLFEPTHAVTASQMVDPNRMVETIRAVKVEPVPQGGFLITMDHAFAGWLELRIPGGVPAGTLIKLEYADFKPDVRGTGKASPNLFQMANQRDEAITAGSEMTFRSRFNYHGFQYVRVTGLDRPPSVHEATGYLIRTSYKRAGEFTSSSELMNRIYQMVTRTYESLTLGGYVVDCPTRERLGYGGDAGTSFETGMFNFSTGGLYNRWLSNWRDSQQPETGSLPHTAPNYPDQGGGGPMWGGFTVTLPWQMYLQYGDKRVLETNYPMIRKWLGYLQSETVDHILVNHKSHAMSMQEWNFLGDWLPPRKSTEEHTADLRSIQLINSLHFLYQVQLASKIAGILDMREDAAQYTSQAGEISRAIHQRFYNPATHTYATGESVYEAFPLWLGVVPAELRPQVMQSLEDTIRVKNAGHFDTGMHGTYFLMKYLMAADRNDLIYEMASKKDFPGWGYMLGQGATTSWESWSGESHIHDTLISIGAWFIEGIGGIRVDENAPGFKHFFIQPGIVGDLTFANAKYQSIHGEIASSWRIESGSLKLDVTVPSETTATVLVPGDGPVQVSPSAHATAAEIRSGRAVFEVGPGRYLFEAKLAERK